MKKPMKNTTTSSMFPTLSHPMTIYTTMFRSFPCISSTGSSSTRCIPIPNTAINNRIFQTAVTYRNHIDTFSTSNCTFLRSNCFHTFSVNRRPMHSLLSPTTSSMFPTLSHPISSTIQYVLPSRFESLACISSTSIYPRTINRCIPLSVSTNSIRTMFSTGPISSTSYTGTGSARSKRAHIRTRVSTLNSRPKVEEGTRF